MSLYDDFAETPHAYHVFLALRLIEAEFADGPRLGESRRPREDAVRLGQEATLAFQKTTIHAFTPPSGGQPARLKNNFFGFFGSHGPLPSHLSEYARERERVYRDPTMVAFADMLTHRMMSLLYRAWATGHPAPSLDRGGDSPWDGHVAALSGHHGRHLRGRDALPDVAKRHFAAHLARGPKNAEGLGAMVSSFFDTPVEVDEFVGSWLALEPGDQWQLGSAAGLGQGTSLGSKVWSRVAKFRLRLGPLALEDYRRLLPGSASLDRLTAIVRNYVGDALDWDVNLVLAADQVPAAVLGQTTHLGLTSWIGQRKGGGDATDLYLSPGVSAARDFSGPGDRREALS